jgi:hypothetical protein
MISDWGLVQWVMVGLVALWVGAVVRYIRSMCPHCRIPMTRIGSAEVNELMVRAGNGAGWTGRGYQCPCCGWLRFKATNVHTARREWWDR